MTLPQNTLQSKWRRVKKDFHCPICGRSDWCLVSADGGAAICARIESPKRCGESGWLHRLRDAPLWRPKLRAVRSIRIGSSQAARQDLSRLAADYQRAVDPGRLNQFATSLGLTVDTLLALHIGWSPENRAWAFPMTNTQSSVVGIRLRRPNGFKFAVAGGREGLFLPSTIGVDISPLCICEGPTDTAAMLDLGFPNVIGRPSCTGGIRLLVELVRQRQAAEVVIVADGDGPGQRGADNLACVLTVYAPSVRVIRPPEGLKDAREWLRAGATRQDVQRAIERAPVRRLTVGRKAVSNGRR